MVRIEATAAEVVVEGRLFEETCEKFEKALERLQCSGVKVPTVDLARVTAFSSKPAELLFTMWKNLLREGRAFVLLAPNHVWEMLARAAVDRMLVKRPAGAARLVPGGPSTLRDASGHDSQEGLARRAPQLTGKATRNG